jgi:hypothetical protein
MLAVCDEHIRSPIRSELSQLDITVKIYASYLIEDFNKSGIYQLRYWSKDKEKRVRLAASRAQPKKAKKLPPIEEYARRFIEKMQTVKNPYSSILKDGSRMLSAIDSLDDALARKIASEIRATVKRHSAFALSLAEAFEETNRRRIRLLIEGRVVR